MDFAGNWDKYLLLMKFAYNNSCQATIQMATYEVLYGRRCRCTIFWEEGAKRQLLGQSWCKLPMPQSKRLKLGYKPHKAERKAM